MGMGVFTTCANCFAFLNVGILPGMFFLFNNLCLYIQFFTFFRNALLLLSSLKSMLLIQYLPFFYLLHFRGRSALYKLVRQTNDFSQPFNVFVFCLIEKLANYVASRNTFVELFSSSQ